MPNKGYRISKDVEGCKSGYAVVSKDSGRILGCHKTRGEAIKQLGAVYASEARAKEKK